MVVGVTSPAYSHSCFKYPKHLICSRIYYKATTGQGQMLLGLSKPPAVLQSSGVILAHCKLLSMVSQSPPADGRWAAPVSKAGTAGATGRFVVSLPQQLPSGFSSWSFNKNNLSLQIQAPSVLTKLIARPSLRKHSLVSRKQIKSLFFQARYVTSLQIPNTKLPLKKTLKS